MFTISHEHLEKACEVNSFPVPSTGMVLFGFRGCLPVDTANHDFKTEHQLDITAVDYISPRCTLGQWLPADKKFAVFPGSTAPHKNYTVSGVGSANQLMTGYYFDYRKGTHKAGMPTGHEAFKQTQGGPTRRDSNRDLKYDERDDRVEYDFSLDNIHSAWCKSVNSINHASAGCQVVVGYPKCPSRGNNPDAGPWKVFKKNAYARSQNSFPYFLLEGLNIQEVVNKMGAGIKIAARLRFGSNSDLVTELQKKLQAKGLYEGILDTDFGNRTLRAVFAFQESQFGNDQDNGVVGPVTAEALGLKSKWLEF
jgi:hypothetical protein